MVNTKMTKNELYQFILCTEKVLKKYKNKDLSLKLEEFKEIFYKKYGHKWNEFY